MSSDNVFRTPKKAAGRLLKRAKDRGNESLLKLKHKVTGLTTAESDVSSPPKTPRSDEGTTMREFFTGCAELPSPPRNDMTLGDAHRTLTRIFPKYMELRESEDANDNEKYCKLLYAVGRKFFDHLVPPTSAARATSSSDAHGMLAQKLCTAQIAAEMIIDRDDPAGKRYHTLFSVHDENDRQWKLEDNERKTTYIREYEYYIELDRLANVEHVRKNDPANIYEVFNDKETFPNLVTQYRVQDSSNCFAQAAILVHFYLQLVHDKDLKKESAYICNFSRFMRNFYQGKDLYEYIIEDEGDTFKNVLNKLLDGDYDVPEEYGDLAFDKYVEKLKEHGPAIVKMFIGEDFHAKNKWLYKGNPARGADDKIEGHAMLLVGVMKVGEHEHMAEGKDMFFILQNFWKDKQFVMVRRDYFRACNVANEGGQASVNFIVYNSEFKSANYEDIYAQKAVADVSWSSSSLERPSVARTMCKIVSKDSNGDRHTRWV